MSKSDPLKSLCITAFRGSSTTFTLQFEKIESSRSSMVRMAPVKQPSVTLSNFLQINACHHSKGVVLVEGWINIGQQLARKPMTCQ